MLSATDVIESYKLKIKTVKKTNTFLHHKNCLQQTMYTFYNIKVSLMTSTFFLENNSVLMRTPNSPGKMAGALHSGLILFYIISVNIPAFG